MTRLIQSSLIAVIILLAVAFAFYYFLNKGAGVEAIMKAVPSETACVIKLKLSNDNIHSLESNTLLSRFRQTPLVIKLNTLLQKIKDESSATSPFAIFTKNDLFISLLPTKANNFDALYLMSTTNMSEDDMKVISDALWGKVSNVQKRNYDGIDITVLTIGNEEFCFAYIDKVLVGSFTAFLVEDAIRQSSVGVNSGAANLYLASVKDKEYKSDAPFQVIVHHGNLNKLTSLFTNNGNKSDENLNLSVFNANVDENTIDLTGKTTLANNESFLSCFRDQQPVPVFILENLPSNTAMFTTYAFSNKELLKGNIIQYYKGDAGFEKAVKECNEVEAKTKAAIAKTINELVDNELSIVVTEPAGAELANHSFAFANNENARSRIFRAVSLAKSIKGLPIVSENYKNRQIVKLPSGHFLQSMFGNAFANITENYVAAIDQCIVFCNSEEALKALIDKADAKQLFKNNTNYAYLKSKFNTLTNVLTYYNPDLMDNLILASLNDDWSPAYESNRLPFSNCGQVIITHTVSAKVILSECMIVSSPKIVRGLDLLFTRKIPGGIIGQVHSVISSNDTLKYILAQDTAYNIMVINKSGTTIDTIPCRGEIFGEVYAVDKGNNGNYFFTFTTDSLWYMVKPDGTNAEGFPRRLPSMVSAPMSIYDFDENANYKVYIPCRNGMVYAYNINGTPVSEWNYKQSSIKLVTELQPVYCTSKLLLCATGDKKEFITIDPETGIRTDSGSQKYCSANSGFMLLDKNKCMLAFLDTTGVVKIMDQNYVLHDAPLIGMPYANVAYEDITGEGSAHYVTLDDKNIAVYNADNTELFQYALKQRADGNLYFLNGETNEKYIMYTYANSSIAGILSPAGKEIKGGTIKLIGRPVVSDLNNDGNSEIIFRSANEIISVYTIK